MGRRHPKIHAPSAPSANVYHARRSELAHKGLRMYMPRTFPLLDVDELVDEIAMLGDRVRNWGRWGADDEIGTLNFITPAKRAAAAQLVRKGVTFSLQIPMNNKGPMTGAGRVNPVHTMTATGCDDIQAVAMSAGARYTDDVMFLYLQSGTEWDGLAHVFYDGRLYNGYDASNVDSNGAHKVGIDKTCSAYVSRGVLLDVARFHGVDCLSARRSTSKRSPRTASRMVCTNVSSSHRHSTSPARSAVPSIHSR